jgi:hypothetical protein
VSSSPDSQYLDIYPSVRLHFLLVIPAVLYHVFSLDLAIRNIDILFRDINVVEEVMVHIIVVGLCVVVLDGIVLVQIESYHILEAELAILMHEDELFIHPNWSTPCCQSQHKGFPSCVLF